MSFLRQLFTNQFSKDVVFSAAFLLSTYALTHNPITRPVPQPLPGNWSIQLMQHPLFFGLAGHNYLVLRNQDGDIVSELHGLATDAKSGTWKYIGTNATDTLKAWAFDGPRYYLAEKSFPGFILEEGSSTQVEALWQKGKSCIDPINNENIPYPPFGINMRGDTINSNSVAYTLARCMELDSKHLGIFTPGDNRDLLEGLQLLGK